MRGPKRRVVETEHEADDTGRQWVLTLECGHWTTRPVKRRRNRLGVMMRDCPAPTWVYCERCKEDETQ